MTLAHAWVLGAVSLDRVARQRRLDCRLPVFPLRGIDGDAVGVDTGPADELLETRSVLLGFPLSELVDEDAHRFVGLAGREVGFHRASLLLQVTLVHAWVVWRDGLRDIHWTFRPSCVPFRSNERAAPLPSDDITERLGERSDVPSHSRTDTMRSWDIR